MVSKSTKATAVVFKRKCAFIEHFNKQNKKSILSNLNFRHNIASYSDRFCFAVKIFPNKATESTVACLGCVYINSDTFKHGIFFSK